MSKKSYGYRKNYRKQKWASVITEINGDLLAINGNSNNGWVIPLCSNAANTTTAPTATIIKTGNFKVSFEVETGAGNYQAVTGRAFIVFIPQGINATVDWAMLHPEYVMGWRSIQVGGSTSAVTISSKLKRNLNSGDKVSLIVQVWNYQTYSEQAPNPVYVKLVGACSYVCRSN